MSIRKNILDGIRVIDLSQFLSGPHATLLLAGLGAEVIRVDHPKTGTSLAKTPIYFGKNGPSFNKKDETDIGISFLKRCRSKKSVTIDLKTKLGHDLFLKLVEKSDILVENFSVGVTERLKVNWHILNQINPRLIYCSLTGYGSTGPDSHRKGYDTTTQAMSGLMSVTGQPGGPPTKAGTPLADTIAASFALSGILAALYHRESTGLGQFVDISMVDTLFSSLFDDPIDCFEELGLNFQQGNRLVRFSPFNTYKTKDSWIVICCGTDEMWKKLCKTIDRLDLSKEKNWSRMDWRVAHNDKVDDLISSWTSKFSTKSALKILENEDIVASPVQDINDLLNWNHLKYREMINDVEHPQLGKLTGIKAAGFPIKFSDAETGYKGPALPSGTNNNQIFGELIGLKEKDLKELRDKNII